MQLPPVLYQLNIMKFSAQEIQDLRVWSINKLENMSVSTGLLPLQTPLTCHSSDADPDVLGDYVLALLKTDAPDDSVRRNASEHLQEFLHERQLRVLRYRLQS